MATDTKLQAAFRRLFRVHLWLAPQFRSAAAQDFTGGSRSRHTQARSWDDEERGGAGGLLHTRTDVARGSPARASASLEPKTQPHRASSIPAPQRPAPSSADHRVQQALAHGLRESRAEDVSQRQWPTEEVSGLSMAARA